MAITQEGSRLTEAHRLLQIEVAQNAVREAAVAWSLLRFDSVDRTFPSYAAVLLSVLERYKRESSLAAAQYMRIFRLAEGVEGDAPVTLLEDLSRRQALTSLYVTGPATLKTATRVGRTEDEARRIALTKTLGAVTRLVLQGARDTIMESIWRDDKALGFARITRGDPCYFCAMLASRGPVYKSRKTARFKPHDKCQCQPEPVYSEDWKWPDSSAEFERLWKESTGDYKDKINAFRRAYERRQQKLLG